MSVNQPDNIKIKHETHTKYHHIKTYNHQENSKPPLMVPRITNFTLSCHTYIITENKPNILETY